MAAVHCPSLRLPPRTPGPEFCVQLQLEHGCLQPGNTVEQQNCMVAHPWPPCHVCAGEASAILARAQATAQGIHMLADAIRQQGGSEAVALRVAEQYLDNFGEIAKAGTTMLLPAATHDPASMVASALSIYKQVSGSGSGEILNSITGGAGSSSAGSSASGSSGGEADSRPAAHEPPPPPPRPPTPTSSPRLTKGFTLQHVLE